MKKIVCLCVVLLIALYQLAASSDFLNPRQKAMGGIRVAVCSPDVPFFDNPAAVYFYNKLHSFFLSAGTSAPVAIGLPKGLNIGGKAQFMSRNIALGITANIESTNVRRDTDCYLTDISKGFRLDADIAFGYRFFGIGLTVGGGSDWMRYDACLEDGSQFVDYFKQAILGGYSRLNSSQYLEVGAGAIFNIWNVKIGVLCDNIFSRENGTMDFTVKGQNMLDTLGAGVYYQMDSFSERGRFRPFVFSFGLEAQKIGLKDRTVNFGTEARLQITKTESISLRAGLDMILARFVDSASTYGFGVRFGKCDISASAVVPFAMYKGVVDKDFVVSVCFGYTV